MERKKTAVFAGIFEKQAKGKEELYTGNIKIRR
jgi:hypothetical protein